MKRESRNNLSPRPEDTASGNEDVAAELKETAKDAVETGVAVSKSKVREGLSAVREKGSDAANETKRRAAENAHEVSKAIAGLADGFSEKGQHGMAGVSRTLADKVDALAEDVRDRDLGDLVRQAEAFARRNPALVLGGAALVGFMASRFLKSTEPSQDTETEEYPAAGGDHPGQARHPAQVGAAPGTRSNPGARHGRNMP